MSEFKLKFHPNPRQLNFNILLREFSFFFSSVAFSIVCGVSFNLITSHEPAFAGIWPVRINMVTWDYGFYLVVLTLAKTSPFTHLS